MNNTKTKTCFGILLPWLVVTTLFMSCQQFPDLEPRIERITPSSIASGQERFIVIHGVFSPRLTWNPGKTPEISTDFAVSFDGNDSDRVRLASSTELVARVPAMSEPGCIDVVVTGPTGLIGIKHNGLCIVQAAQEELVGSCVVGEKQSLCTFEQDPHNNSLHTEILQEDVLVLTKSPTGWLFDHYHRGYRISVDGSGLLFLRQGRLGNEGGLVRQLLYRNMDKQTLPLVVEKKPQPENGTPADSEPVQALADPVLSPDGSMAVWLEDECRLLVADLSQDFEQPMKTRVLTDICDQQDYAIALPDMDILNKRVVYTRYNKHEPEHRSLWIVPADGSQPALELTNSSENEPENFVKNGPGVFSADGGSVIFLSDRLGMQILSPFMSMFNLTNLYRMDLNDKSIKPITPPLAGVFAGRPELSPDGRMAASTGFLSEKNLQVLDILLTDLEQEKIYQIGSDGGPFCYPPGTECEENTALGCCTQDRCCTLEEPENCMSWEILPAFSPNSHSMVGNTFPMLWFCEIDAQDTQPGWGLYGFDVGVFQARKQQDGRFQAFRYLPDQFNINENTGLAPSFRQRFDR